MPSVDREMYRSNRPELPWHEQHGDRRTELVFIGTDYDESAIEASLTDTFVGENASGSTETQLFPTEAGTETVIREP
jgi:hypothetical protein